MTETQIQAAILKRLGGRPDVRLFRNHVGSAWHGRLGRQTIDTLLLHAPRRVRCGLAPGSSDLIGLVDDHGWPGPGGRFLAIEVKRPGKRASKSQQAFIDTIKRMGGIAFVATSADEAEAKLEEATG